MYVCTAGNGVGHDKTAKAFVTIQCKSTAHHVKEILVAAATKMSNVAAKELIFCVMVNCMAQSYNLPSRICLYETERTLLNNLLSYEMMQ